MAQQPAPAARGVGHERHEGGHERDHQLLRPRRLVGRGLRRRATAGPSAGARRTPTRAPRTGPTRRTCTGCSRPRSCRATTSATRKACPTRWLEMMRGVDGHARLAVLDQPHAPGVRRAAVPAGRRERPRAAATGRGRQRCQHHASSHGSADASAHLARADPPQPPAGGQLRLGHRARSTTRPTSP